MTQTHRYMPGDSVLARVDGNQVPGVVLEDRDDQLLVELARPYADSTGQSQSQVWCTADELEPLRDESAPEQLPG